MDLLQTLVTILCVSSAVAEVNITTKRPTMTGPSRIDDSMDSPDSHVTKRQETPDKPDSHVTKRLESPDSPDSRITKRPENPDSPESHVTKSTESPDYPDSHVTKKPENSDSHDSFANKNSEGPDSDSRTTKSPELPDSHDSHTRKDPDPLETNFKNKTSVKEQKPDSRERQVVKNPENADSKDSFITKSPEFQDSHDGHTTKAPESPDFPDTYTTKGPESPDGHTNKNTNKQDSHDSRRDMSPESRDSKATSSQDASIQDHYKEKTATQKVAISNLQSKVEEAFKIAQAKNRIRSYLRTESFIPNFFELFPLPRREAYSQQQTRLALISLDAISHLSKNTSYPAKSLLGTQSVKDTLQTEFLKICNDHAPSLSCDREEEYRKIDGSCNNLEHPHWGMAGSTQTRFLPPDYEDGLMAPRVTGKDGRPLPSPRLVSNVVHKADGRAKDRKFYLLSAMVMQWGQFIMHDISGTPTMKDESRASFDCCGRDRLSDACIPISIPDDDPYFKTNCMNAVRSVPAVGPGCQIDVRQQMNKVTSFLDGSAIYGSSTEELKMLREPFGGLMREGPHGLLPQNPQDDCIRITSKDTCQQAGDERPNVLPSVGALHTLFLREHNRIATKLGEVNSKWDNERIFQEAKKIVSALLEHITYKEYLPLILGSRNMNRYILVDAEFEHQYIYNEYMNPTITNVFSSAAFRFAHSSIPAKQTYVGPQFEKKRGLGVEHTFHKPYYLQRSKDMGYEGLMRWLISDPQPNIDRSLEDGLRNKLFIYRNISLDLAALNIQRGREHGIPSYNRWRKWCGLPVAKSFISGRGGLTDHDSYTVQLLEQVYRSTDDIDLFTGGVSEIHDYGAYVGPTFACIIGRQFRALKTGDRFWYETPEKAPGFTLRQLDSIKEIYLSKIICENMNIPDIQRSVFLTPRISGRNRRRIPCSMLADLDLYAWTESDKSWIES